MSSMLRSLRFVRRLNLGCAERRLGAALHREVAMPEAAAATAARRLDRNYVTAATKAEFTEHHLINQKLDDMDRRIKSYGNIYSTDVEAVLQIAAKGHLDSTQALLLIRSCGEFLSSESSEIRKSLVTEIWQLLKKLEIQLDVSHYNAFLLVNLENETDFSPLDILLEMKDKNIQPNRVTFQRLIEQYCNKGDIAGATKILEHMNQHEIPLNESIFISLMKGHLNAGDPANAIKLLDVMKQAGIQPSSHAFSALMCVYAKSGDLDSIMKVLSDCKEKDILLSNKDILEVIYMLTINNYSEHVDKLIDQMSKGSTYNKEVIVYIRKLLEKKEDEVAFKLLKTLTKSKFHVERDAGHFFIRKLVALNSDVEKIIKFCKLMKDEKLNSSSLLCAIYSAYLNKFHHMAFPLLKELKESGDEIREQHFFPILANHSSKNNLKDLADSVKIITNDFKINLSTYNVKDYIISNLSDKYYMDVAENLAKEGLSFFTTAHAILTHLLENNKLVESLDFMNRAKIWYRLNFFSSQLVNAFVNTKDVESFVDILHYLYMKLPKENTIKTESETEDKDKLPSNFQMISDIVAKAIQNLPANDINLVEKILQRLLEKGVYINQDAATAIKNHLGKNLNSNSEKILSKLISETFYLDPINSKRLGERNEKFLDHSQKLNYLKEQSKESTDFKMLLIQEHAKAMNRQEVEKLLKEIEQENPKYTAAFCAVLFDYYSKSENIVEADKWYNYFLEMYPNSTIDRNKTLHYAKALVQNKRPTDALKVLEHQGSNQLTEKDKLSTYLLNEVMRECPNYLEEFFRVLKQHGYIVQVTTGILGPLVKVHLLTGDIDKAINKFEWCCVTYEVAPMRRQLMKELIMREDAKTLQNVTSLVTRVFDEIQALHDLALAFFECDRPRQARKVLETPGLRLRIRSILMAAELYKSVSTEKLEKFIQLFKGLYIDLNPLYYLLLNAYKSENDWKKCLALWTQMQEDNIQPSSNFMIELDRILRKYNQPVPFTISDKPYDVSKEFYITLMQKNFKKAGELVSVMSNEKKPPHLLQLIQAYAGENNTTEALKYINELIDIANSIKEEYFNVISSVFIQLAKKDDFSNIVTTLKKIKNVAQKKKSSDRTMGYIAAVNEAYLESGQFSKFIEHLDNLLDDSQNEKFLSPIISSIVIKALNQHPELEDKFREYAIKALKYGSFKPISTLWTHYFVQDSPEAVKIWDEHLSETSNIFPVSAVTICIERKAFDKIPTIVEKVQQSKRISISYKRIIFAAILKTLTNSDCPEKYDIAFECLRHASKAVSINVFNDKLIQAIQENVTNGQTIESLKMENERTKTEATG